MDIGIYAGGSRTGPSMLKKRTTRVYFLAIWKSEFGPSSFFRMKFAHLFLAQFEVHNLVVDIWQGGGMAFGQLREGEANENQWSPRVLFLTLPARDFNLARSRNISGFTVLSEEEGEKEGDGNQ